MIQYICSIEAWTNESFNMAESAWLQYMSSAFGWSNSTYQPFLTSNWHFWQMVQMSAQCLLSKNEKAQISAQMQIIYTGWQHCRQPYISYVLYDHLLRILFVLFWRSEGQKHYQGSCTYYVITFGGPETPLPPIWYCNHLGIPPLPPPYVIL